MMFYYKSGGGGSKVANAGGSDAVPDYSVSVIGKLQHVFITNRHSSLAYRIINVLVKLACCVCYVVREIVDCENYEAAGNDLDPHIRNHCYQKAHVSDHFGETHDENGEPTWDTLYKLILWVDRRYWLWVIQTVLACLSVALTFIHVAVRHKTILSSITHRFVLIELFASVPFIVSIAWVTLRVFYIPSFLLCWIVKELLMNAYRDQNRDVKKKDPVSEQLLDLLLFLVCMLFTGMCGMTHLQRAGATQMTLFESFYFLIVTISTVGYGDFSPDYWLSRIYVIILIIIVLIIIPGQLDQMGQALASKRRMGGTYSEKDAKRDDHVIVSINGNSADIVLDFLVEFYAHFQLRNYYVILLIPEDIDHETQLILNMPSYQGKVIFMRGSVLRSSDLERARAKEAKGVFLLNTRSTGTTLELDQRAVLRAWAVKDYAPDCRQFVHFFRPRTKMHLKFADFIVCEHEFKYALLANNCICPAISTFITLILHTSDGEEGQTSDEEWMRVYGKHSGNEIYCIKLGKSRWFGEFADKPFTYASYMAHRKHGIGLVAVRSSLPGASIQLNPGKSYILSEDDRLYYFAVTREEQYDFKKDKKGGRSGEGSDNELETRAYVMPSDTPSAVDRSPEHNQSSLASDLPQDKGGRVDVGRLLADKGARSRDRDDGYDDDESRGGRNSGCSECGKHCVKDMYQKGQLPYTPYVGTSQTTCYLTNPQRNYCCVRLDVPCDHCPYTTAKDYRFKNPLIILTADVASNGLYNFIVPLRAHYRDPHKLKPIVLLLETEPRQAFVDMFAWFPDVYWMLGNFDNLRLLLNAGINFANKVVIVNKVSGTGGGSGDEFAVDSESIIGVQQASRYFPAVQFISELTFWSNMRFMQFDPHDPYALQQSDVEELEEDLGSKMPFIFRLPFACGKVFSATMLDTLLYQAFRKDYLIEFIRLLLGIDQVPGSGYLDRITLTKNDVRNFPTYTAFYEHLAMNEAVTPFAVYRTESSNSKMAAKVTEAVVELGGDSNAGKHRSLFKAAVKDLGTMNLNTEWAEINNLVRYNMRKCDLPEDLYMSKDEHRGDISYVIVNPDANLKLREGDFVYVFMHAKPLESPDVDSDHRSYRKKRSRSDSQSRQRY